MLYQILGSCLVWQVPSGPWGGREMSLTWARLHLCKLGEIVSICIRKKMMVGKWIERKKKKTGSSTNLNGFKTKHESRVIRCGQLDWAFSIQFLVDQRFRKSHNSRSNISYFLFSHPYFECFLRPLERKKRKQRKITGIFLKIFSESWTIFSFI